MKSTLKRIVSVALMAAACILFAAQAFAQLEVTLKPQREDYMLGEDVALELTLFNNSDSSIALARTPDQPWLTITVRRAGEKTDLAPKVRANFPNVTLGPAQKMAYKIDLKQIYNLPVDGLYRVHAVVCLSDRKTTFTSPKARFRVGSGALLKKFTTHVRGKRLEMRAKLWRIGERNALFGQLADADSGRVLAAAHMGQYLNFMEPRFLLDAKQNLHMLFQSTPEFFTYSIFSTTGKCSLSQIYKRIPGGPIELVSVGGSIRVIGAAPYVKPKDGVHRDANERPF